MPTAILLLRGINVGGKNKLPMADLRAILGELGLDNVATYIQSGNAVARSTRKLAKSFAKKLSDAIEDAHGFAPDVLALTQAELEAAIDANPFPQATQDPKTLHVFFLEKPAAPARLEDVEALAAKSERFALTDAAFYLWAPDGIGRSKLAARVEKALGVRGTGRNWRTVLKLREMCGA